MIYRHWLALRERIKGMRILMWFAGWLLALILIVWRATLRKTVIDDPRPVLRESGTPYVYAVLHAQQLSFFMLSDDTPIAAMVSASTDGNLLVPICKACNVIPVRGSTAKNGKEKGGREALLESIRYVRDERIPALLAVDGPRGPRRTVHRGVLSLARKANARIVVAGVFPSSRHIFKNTWDRTQIPLPFSKITGRFRPIIDPDDFPDREVLRNHVIAELRLLEEEFDPVEAAHGAALAEKGEKRPRLA